MRLHEFLPALKQNAVMSLRESKPSGMPQIQVFSLWSCPHTRSLLKVVGHILLTTDMSFFLSSTGWFLPSLNGHWTVFKIRQIGMFQTEMGREKGTVSHA